jgi:hypothetical protein
MRWTDMPRKKTIDPAEQDRAEGKSPSTQAGEFVREEMHHVRAGKHGGRSTKQAIAIGLSKARRAGVELPPPEPGTTSEETREKAKRDVERPRRGQRAASPRRARAVHRALEREGHEAASPRALAAQAKSAARRRGHADLSAAAGKAARTKGPAQRKAAARKAARTRARRRRR